jgi:hypothetical protein
MQWRLAGAPRPLTSKDTPMPDPLSHPLRRAGAIAVALVALLGAGAAQAQAPKKATTTTAPAAKDKKAAPVTWAMSLAPGDKKPIDGKAWVVDVYDAVQCKDLATGISLSTSRDFKIATVANGGQATGGALGAHVRWRAFGAVPGHTKKMYFWGDPKPTKDGAAIKLAVDPSIGTEQIPAINKCTHN